MSRCNFIPFIFKCFSVTLKSGNEDYLDRTSVLAPNILIDFVKCVRKRESQNEALVSP